MAHEASYIVSTEHKSHLTGAGPGRLRSDASKCPKELKLEQVTEWLKAAMKKGDVSAVTDLFRNMSGPGSKAKRSKPGSATLCSDSIKDIRFLRTRRRGGWSE